jgi:hypothetical protein
MRPSRQPVFRLRPLHGRACSGCPTREMLPGWQNRGPRRVWGGVAPGGPALIGLRRGFRTAQPCRFWKAFGKFQVGMMGHVDL